MFAKSDEYVARFDATVISLALVPDDKRDFARRLCGGNIDPEQIVRGLVRIIVEIVRPHRRRRILSKRLDRLRADPAAAQAHRHLPTVEACRRKAEVDRVGDRTRQNGRDRLVAV